MTESEVRTALGDLGLIVTVETGSAANSPQDVGKVYSVNPTGPLTRGDRVTAVKYGEMPLPAKPGALNASSTTGPAGSTIDISWPAYVCPGTLNLVAYEFQLDGGSLSPSSPIPPGTTNAEVTLPEMPGTIHVSYNVSCGGISSPEQSDVLTLTAE